MGDVKVVLNRKGVAELLRSNEIRKDLLQRGRAIAARAGGEGHYKVSVNTGRSRARVGIITDTEDAMIDEATQRSLSSALDAGR